MEWTLLGAVVAALTPRQQEIVAALGASDSMGEASARLGMHPAALTARARSISNRLGFASSQAFVSAARRHHLLDACTDPLLGVAPDGRCLFANRNASALLGYETTFLVGSNAHQLIHGRGPDGQEVGTEECPIHQVVAGRQSASSGESLFWRSDGSRIWAGYDAVAGDGPGTQTVTVVAFHDASDRLRSERDLLLAQTGLALALDAVGGEVFSVDLRTGETHGLSHLMDVPDGADYQQVVQTCVHPDDRPPISLDRLRRLPAGARLYRDVRIRSGTDRYLTLQAGVVAVPDRTGSPEVLVGMLRDAERRR